METVHEVIDWPIRNQRKFGEWQNFRASFAGHLGSAYFDEAHAALNRLDWNEAGRMWAVADLFWYHSDKITDELDLGTPEGRLIVRN